MFISILVCVPVLYHARVVPGLYVGIKKLRFKPAYNPYTEPSMEIFRCIVLFMVQLHML
jgi:hypothetical protein